MWEGGEKNIPGAREPRVSASSCEKPCSSLELVLLRSVLLDQKVAEDRLLMLLLYTGLTIGHRKGPVNKKCFEKQGLLVSGSQAAKVTVNVRQMLP